MKEVNMEIKRRGVNQWLNNVNTRKQKKYKTIKTEAKTPTTCTGRTFSPLLS
jgi:hypothetical protein